MIETRLTAMLTVMQSRLFSMNAGLLALDQDFYFIDPGIFPDEIDAIATLANGKCGGKIRGLIITHSHWDHVLGPQRIQGVPVIAHATTEENMRTRADAINVAALEHLSADETSPTYFTAPAVTTPIATRDTLPFGSETLQIIHAPGHCSDQIVVYFPAESTLWAADMLSDLEIPFVEDIDAYERTLKQLRQLEILTLVPGHGNPTSDQREIQHRLQRDLYYLDRLNRTVADGMKQGRSLEELQRELCDWPIPNPTTNAAEHTRNITTVYAAAIQHAVSDTHCLDG